MMIKKTRKQENKETRKQGNDEFIYFHQANDVSNLDEESMNGLKELQRVAAYDDPMLPIDFIQEFKSISNINQRGRISKFQCTNLQTLCIHPIGPPFLN